MLKIKMADHVFAIENKFTYIEQLCMDYKTTEQPQFHIQVTNEEISAENQSKEAHSMAYLESLAVYRKIVEFLLKDDIVLFHSSALSIDGKAYLFTAPSGTGKSTHARLWREYFGSRVTMINDDKPLLSVRKDAITVYGTPYGGKDHIQTNTSAEVSGIVILHQAKQNEIRRMTSKEAYPMLLNQTYRRLDMEGMIKTMNLVQKLSELPVYSLGCTISREAAELVWNTLNKAGGDC